MEATKNDAIVREGVLQELAWDPRVDESRVDATNEKRQEREKR